MPRDASGRTTSWSAASARISAIHRPFDFDVRAADQLLKGAALNAIQIAELLPERVMV